MRELKGLFLQQAETMLMHRVMWMAEAWFMRFGRQIILTTGLEPFVCASLAQNVDLFFHLFSFLFVYVFVSFGFLVFGFWFPKTGFLCVTLAILELTL